jgi:hypothetical protein
MITTPHKRTIASLVSLATVFPLVVGKPVDKADEPATMVAAQAATMYLKTRNEPLDCHGESIRRLS